MRARLRVPRPTQASSVLVGFRPVCGHASCRFSGVSQILASNSPANCRIKNIENLRNFTRPLASGRAGLAGRDLTGPPLGHREEISRWAVQSASRRQIGKVVYALVGAVSSYDPD